MGEQHLDHFAQMLRACIGVGVGQGTRRVASILIEVTQDFTGWHVGAVGALGNGQPLSDGRTEGIGMD